MAPQVTSVRPSPLVPLGAIAVRVLELDPDLGEGLESRDWPLAVAASIAPAFDFDRGPWQFLPRPDRGSFGALIVGGMIVVRIDVGPRSHLELLGEGDVLSPWSGAGQELATPSVANSAVVAPLRVALLDRAFALRTARWPEIHAAIVQRLVARVRRLSLQAAINAVTRVEDRLELTLWHIAQRFGHVTSQGILLELPLSHAQLADMLAAQRPSVSTAVGRLQAQGRAIREDRHRWRLTGGPPQILNSLARQSGLQR
jgi:CRP/FNR family cyclic AMP-dependent transcriptional regulator